MFGFNKKKNEEMDKLNGELDRIRRLQKQSLDLLTKHEKYIDRISSIVKIFEKGFRESITKDGSTLFMYQSLGNLDNAFGYKFMLKFSSERNVFELYTIDNNREPKKSFAEQFITLVKLMDNIKNDIWYLEEVVEVKVQAPTVGVEEVNEEFVNGKVALAHMLNGGKVDWNSWIYFINHRGKLVYFDTNGIDIIPSLYTFEEILKFDINSSKFRLIK